MSAVSQEGGAGFEDPRQGFLDKAKSLPTAQLAKIPVRHEGRIKPFDSLARETVLFITGKYKFWGLDPVQMYFGMVLFEQVDRLEIVNIREPDIREQLGFARDRRYVSVKELTDTNLQQLAMPLMQQQEASSKSLKPMEKQLLDVFHQVWLVRQVQSADQLFEALQFSDAARSGQDGAPHGGGR